MLFLLVTLLANHGDASCHNHAYRLQSAIKQELGSQAFLAITRYGHPKHMHIHQVRRALMPTRPHLDPGLGPTQYPGGMGKGLGTVLSGQLHKTYCPKCK